MSPITTGTYTSLTNNKEVEVIGNAELRHLEMPGVPSVIYKKNGKLYVRKQQEFISKFKLKHETSTNPTA